MVRASGPVLKSQFLVVLGLSGAEVEITHKNQGEEKEGKLDRTPTGELRERRQSKRNEQRIGRKSKSRSKRISWGGK